MTTEERKKQAMEYFTEGYNCAQAVALSFKDMVDIDERQLAAISSGFGGGIGRLREVCGAVSGAVMIISMLYGYSDACTGKKKADLYALIQEFAKAFEEENGSIICRELRGLNVKHDSPVPEPRTQKYYETKPCTELVGSAAELLSELIKRQENSSPAD